MPAKFFSAGSMGQNTGLALVRVIAGLLLVYHGWEVFDSTTMKGYLEWDQFKSSSALFMVYMGKSAELAGGLLLTLGLFTRLAALLIAGTMLYISFFVGHGKVWYEDQHPFLFVLLALVFFFTGPGACSLDQKLFGKK
jgi:putative oxidoreductase